MAAERELQLSEGCVVGYWCEVPARHDEAALLTAWHAVSSVLPPPEVLRISTRIRTIDKLSSGIGYMLMCKCIQALLGRADVGFTICRTPHGRPTVVLPPSCGIHIDANISHQGGYIVCVAVTSPLSANVRVGVDLMDDGSLTFLDYSDGLSSVASVLHPDEITALHAEPNPKPLFSRIWTMKEAIGKVTGVGLTASPSCWSVSDFIQSSRQSIHLDGEPWCVV